MARNSIQKSQARMATMFAEPSFPGIIKVTSNSGDNDTDLSQGFVLLKYYESITQDTVKADFTFADTGWHKDKIMIYIDNSTENLIINKSQTNN